MESIKASESGDEPVVEYILGAVLVADISVYYMKHSRCEAGIEDAHGISIPASALLH